MTTEQQKMGALIRAKRKEKHWTQAKLAEQLNLTRDAIFAYEKGKVKVIPYDKRKKLSVLLDIPISNLLYLSEIDFKEVGGEPYNNDLAKIVVKGYDDLNSAHNKVLESILSNDKTHSIDEDKVNDIIFSKIESDIMKLLLKEINKKSLKDEVYAIINRRINEALNNLTISSKDDDTKK